MFQFSKSVNYVIVLIQNGSQYQKPIGQKWMWSLSLEYVLLFIPSKWNQFIKTSTRITESINFHTFTKTHLYGSVGSEDGKNVFCIRQSNVHNSHPRILLQVESCVWTCVAKYTKPECMNGGSPFTEYFYKWVINMFWDIYIPFEVFIMHLWCMDSYTHSRVG